MHRPAGSLAAWLRRGAWRAMVEPLIRHAGWFCFFVVLAPIIGPRGYGLFVMALSGIAIVAAALSEAVAGALGRIAPLDERHLSTALIGAAGIGAALSLALFVAAGPLELMLDDAPFGDLFRSLSPLPVLAALGAVPTAILRRRAKQGPFAAATAAGLCAGGGVALALAWASAGPWSLVAQIVAQRFVECMVLWGIAARRIGLVWSPAHFAALIGALDLGVLTPVWPVVLRFAPALLVGLVLGPIGAGLFMLAARVAEALDDILLGPFRPVRRALLLSWADEIAAAMRRTALPAALASLLLAIALPPLLDIRWWGAVMPAQLLLLALVPGSLIGARAAAVGSGNEARWQLAQTLGALGVVALAAPFGLVAVAAAALAYWAAVAAVALWPLRRALGPYWPRAIALAVRPLAAATAAGGVLYMLSEPVSLALPPLPALCLLAALGRLCYLLAGGATSGAAAAGIAPRRRLSPAKP